MNTINIDTDLIDRIEEASKLQPAEDLFPEIEKIITSANGHYSALVFFYVEMNKIVVEPLSRNSVLSPDNHKIMLASIDGYSYQDEGLMIDDLFSDDEIAELEDLDDDLPAFFARHPHPTYSERIEDAHYFYFVEKGGWDRVVKDAIQRIKGFI